MPTANSSHFLFGFCFGSLLIELDPSLLQSLSIPIFLPTSPVSLCLPSAFSLFFFFFPFSSLEKTMLILHVPIPLHLHERLWLKAAWLSSCSPPLFSSFPPALPCCTTAPCSTPFPSALLLTEEGEGERLGFLVWFYPQSPHPWPEEPQITRSPAHLQAHWSALHTELS